MPFGLALAAMIARNAEERAAALAEGERVLGEGAVSHNFIFFNRYAIEACLAAKDWAGVQRYATALEQGLAEEPLPMSNFLVARARAIAAAGRGQKDETELRRLLGGSQSHRLACCGAVAGNGSGCELTPVDFQSRS